MITVERTHCLGKELEPKPKKTIVIGGGLSGSVLALALAKKEGMAPVLIEAMSDPEEMSPKNYLISFSIAKELDLKNLWERKKEERGVITGFSTYGVTPKGELEFLEGIDPQWTTEESSAGFVVLTQAELIGKLWQFLHEDGVEIITGVKAIKAEKEENEEFKVTLSNGELIEGKYVIDATGLNSSRKKNWGIRAERIVSEARVRAVYGFQVKGKFSPNQLLFLTGIRMERLRGISAWLMPKGEKEAQIIVNNEISKEEAIQWYRNIHQLWLKIKELFSKIDGVEIDELATRRPIASGYRTSPASVEEIKGWGSVIPFGEIVGFNWPGTGQFVDIISKDAEILANLISTESDRKTINEKFYLQWREQLNYSFLMALAKTRRERQEVTGSYVNPLSRLLTQKIPPEKLWSKLRGEEKFISLEVLNAILKEPESWGFITRVVLNLLPLLIKERKKRWGVKKNIAR